MKKHLIICYLCSLCSLLAADAAPAASQSTAVTSTAKATGHWFGVLTVRPGIELRLAMEVTEPSPGKFEGVVISLDQGSVKLPLDTFTVTLDAVAFTMMRGQINFEGTLRGGNELAGTWKQGPVNAPVQFMRTATTTVLTRPQEPKKPLPYAEEEVVVENKAAGLKLAGTLTLPVGVGPHPAVVLITGSGPQDRDEALAGHRPFLVLADKLTRSGIAVLRCDDRGFGKSGGKFFTAIEADFVEDTLAAVAYLCSRPEIDARRIGLLGHSEGGTIAPRVAGKLSDIAFVVLLAAPGEILGEVVIRQSADIARTMGLSEEAIVTNIALKRELFQIIRSERDAATAETRMLNLVLGNLAAMTDAQKAAVGAASPAFIEQNIKALNTPWFRDLLDYDPQPALRALRCPVLALNGEKDLQVSAKTNLAAIRAALAEGGSKLVRVEELPGLNHLFQTCQTGSPAEYGKIEETFSPVALTLIADWISTVVAR